MLFLWNYLYLCTINKPYKPGTLLILAPNDCGEFHDFAGAAITPRSTIMDNQYDIFISYRRLDTEGKTSGRDIARNIKQELKIRGYNVFFDYSEIKDNEFEEVILPAVRNSKAFILVLSKDALQRCSNEGDWVRREIETAIRSDCKIIPVNPDNSFDGWPDNLSESLIPMTKQQISDISMESLFEKSIEKLIEDRLPQPEHIQTSQQLSRISYLLIYLLLGGICCYFFAKSLYFQFPAFTNLFAWILVLSYYSLYSISAIYIYNSTAPHLKVKNRVRTYVEGVLMNIFFGVFLLMPCMTHFIYYKMCADNEVKEDLHTTQKYLAKIIDGNRESTNVIISLIDNIEYKLVYNQIKTSQREDMLYVDSVLSMGYSVIRNSKTIHYANINDKVQFTRPDAQPRIRTLMQVFGVWKEQIQEGFSKEFLLAFTISLLLNGASLFCYLKFYKG